MSDRAPALVIRAGALIECLKFLSTDLEYHAVSGSRPPWADRLEPLLREPHRLMEVASGDMTLPAMGGWPREGHPAFGVVLAPSEELAELVLSLKADQSRKEIAAARSRLTALRSASCPASPDRSQAEADAQALPGDRTT